MSASDSVKRFESPKRQVRALLVLGVLFLGLDVFVVASMFGDEFAKVPDMVKVGAVVCIALHTVLGAVLVWVGIRQKRYVLEIGERGLRNPNRDPDWLPWESVSSMRFRPTTVSVEVAGDANTRPVRVGIELGLEYARFVDALTTIAERSPGLRSDESTFINPMALRLLAPVLFAPVVYAITNGSREGILLIAFYVTVAVVGTILTVPRRVVVERDAVRVRYLLWRCVIPYEQVNSVGLGLGEVQIRRKERARRTSIRLGRNALSAFLSLRYARETAR